MNHPQLLPFPLGVVGDVRAAIEEVQRVLTINWRDEIRPRVRHDLRVPNERSISRHTFDVTENAAETFPAVFVEGLGSRRLQAQHFWPHNVQRVLEVIEVAHLGSAATHSMHAPGCENGVGHFCEPFEVLLLACLECLQMKVEAWSAEQLGPVVLRVGEIEIL